MKNITGQKFNRWVVIEFAYKNGTNYYWKCKCKCGKYKNVHYGSLTSYSSKSCGCLRKELITKHGDWKSRLYRIWDDMIQRCFNKNLKQYKDYCGRGINICNDWLKYENFRDWALKNGYKDNLQIDRKNNDKGYFSENCRFVTHQQNNFNRGSNKNVTSQYKGVCWDKQHKKWRAKITKDGKQYYLGCFVSEIEAATVYNNKAVELFGEYAYLNHIKGK